MPSAFNRICFNRRRKANLEGILSQFTRHRWLTVWFLLCLSLPTQAAKVDFNRDIRPIMADTCFRCHGFDPKARKAQLRLDIREEALKPAKSGAVPIVPGQPDKSEAIRRIFTNDEDDRMPPAQIKKVLSAEQKELFRRWIQLLFRPTKPR